MSMCKAETGFAPGQFEVSGGEAPKRVQDMGLNRGLDKIYGDLERQGWALLPDFVIGAAIDEVLLTLHRLSDRRGDDLLSRLNLSEQVFTGQLPEPLENWAQDMRAALTPIAHRCMSALGSSTQSASKAAVQKRSGQEAMEARLTYLSTDQVQELWRRDSGEGAFPVQLVVLLSDPGRDFTGGEFVMTEQRPRMQSRPMVIPLKKGDAALIAVAQRPVEGRGGVYHVTLRHGISRIRSGNRIGLELFLG